MSEGRKWRLQALEEGGKAVVAKGESGRDGKEGDELERLARGWREREGRDKVLG